MDKYKNAVIQNKLEDIENSHHAIIEKIAALEMDLDPEKDGQVEEKLRKVHELVGESLKILQQKSE